MRSTPKEDPEAKAQRERERRLAELDKSRGAQDEANDLTSDLRAVYGLNALRSYGTAGRSTSPAKSTAAPSMFRNVQHKNTYFEKNKGR